jgi:hypothetical protein
VNRGERCRLLLRQEFPRSRAKAFLWYLQDGALVTFYRRTGPFQIEVLRRYLHGSAEPAIQPWTGTYDDILAQMWRSWYWWDGSLPPGKDEVPPPTDQQALTDTLLTERESIAESIDGECDSARNLRAIRED